MRLWIPRLLLSSLCFTFWVCGYSQTEFDKTLKAAEQGFAEAQFNLGLIYYTGKGVPKDDIQAHMWLNLSTATGGGIGAKEAREAVAAQMKADQIVEVQKLAREWFEAHSPN
jgi:TPR repeat protein